MTPFQARLTTRPDPVGVTRPQSAATGVPVVLALFPQALTQLEFDVQMKQLLFVDTNIWLDFYRVRTGAGIDLLDRLEKIKDSLIITYQVEMEFKKHRQAAILEGFKALKSPESFSRPGIFSDAKTANALQRNIATIEKRVADLKSRLRRALEKPTTHDPVYKVFQRCCRKADDCSLSRDADEQSLIYKKAFRRFLHGCPPRKPDDTSIGDAINWEWLIRCAKKHNAEIHIASRDSDYGMMFENHAYLNDHLLQEFRERVSQKRGISLHVRLSEALRKFDVKVSRAEESEEDAIIEAGTTMAGTLRNIEDAAFWERMGDHSGQFAKWRQLLAGIDFVKPPGLESGGKLATVPSPAAAASAKSPASALGAPPAADKTE